MSVKDLEPRMHLSKTSTFISYTTENTAYLLQSSTTWCCSWNLCLQ